jgi:hypothetical protein
MQFVGNQKDWITDDLMLLLESKEGDAVPIWEPDRWGGHPLLEDMNAEGKEYFKDNIPKQYFHVFRSTSKDLQGYNFNLPKLPIVKKHLVWWFVKLNPGEMQLMHYDMHVLGSIHSDSEFKKVSNVIEVNNPVRYTMYLQDWHPGHAFIHYDKTVSHYKAGDIYEWSDAELLHGVVNLSFKPRYTLQITMHD